MFYPLLRDPELPLPTLDESWEFCKIKMGVFVINNMKHQFRKPLTTAYCDGRVWHFGREQNERFRWTSVLRRLCTYVYEKPGFCFGERVLMKKNSIENGYYSFETASKFFSLENALFHAVLKKKKIWTREAIIDVTESNCITIPDLYGETLLVKSFETISLHRSG